VTNESKDFDDEDGAGKPPTQDQVLRISAFLQSRNLDYGPRPTHRELQARNFNISIATVQRGMKKAGIKPPEKQITEAQKRRSNERAENTAGMMDRKSLPNPDATKTDKFGMDEIEGLIARKMADIIKTDTTSAMLAIEENRARMALNIVIAEIMAAKPALLLLDMRGTAALVDALTCASKLSGGASLDIKYPTQAEKNAAAAGLSPSGDGSQMKDITPTRTKLADDLAAFRQRRHSNGAGA
jgi:hypothetical protein